MNSQTHSNLWKLKEKLVLLLSLSALCLTPVRSQLRSELNLLRAGDVLYKQQVEYVEAGEAGADRLWNFSKLKTVNDEYMLEYALPPLEGDSVYILGDRRYRAADVKENELIVGTEHNTMYYYRQTEDSLLQMGHENPAVVLAYTSPMAILLFPLNYGEFVSSNYKSKGLYSGTVDIRTEGTVTTLADAYGEILLPSGDTISPVLRVKTIQTIFDTVDSNSNPPEARNHGKQLEIYRWYVKGYRYPVFETLRDINLDDHSLIFSTAFFFPPQDHLYLDTDSANLDLLDQLWNLDKQNIDNPDSEETEKVKLSDILICTIYPNPVHNLLNLDYELKREANVGFQLASVFGLPVKTIAPRKKPAGVYHETIDCSALHDKNYVLRITANELFVNEVIMKK